VTVGRKPEWLKRRLPEARPYRATQALLDGLRLHTVCAEARCPNKGECFASGTATFLILGDRCTRACRFCSVKHGDAAGLDEDEPRRVAEAARRLGLRHVVVTSVTRDDLPDGGAAHYAATIAAIRGEVPQATVEVLIPDLGGEDEARGRVHPPPPPPPPTRCSQPQPRNGAAPVCARAAASELRALARAARPRGDVGTRGARPRLREAAGEDGAHAGSRRESGRDRGCAARLRARGRRRGDGGPIPTARHVVLARGALCHTRGVRGARGAWGGDEAAPHRRPLRAFVLSSRRVVDCGTMDSPERDNPETARDCGDDQEPRASERLQRDDRKGAPCLKRHDPRRARVGCRR